jgi:hypothetical protein
MLDPPAIDDRVVVTIVDWILVLQACSQQAEALVNTLIRLLQAISIAMAMPFYRVFEFAQVITPLNK